MKNEILILILILTSSISFSQNPTDKVLYVVDSIPIIEEPNEGFGTLTENEIDHVVVEKDKKVLGSSGYNDLDGIIYVFTKAYVHRPDSIKVIPTTKLMTREDGIWYLKNISTPYSGRFIDYYLTGKKQGDGVLYNGKLNGKRLLYYPNGNISDEILYYDGISNGLEQRFYVDGTLMHKGNFKDGKEIGIWEMYHPNGKLKQRSEFNENGKMDGVSTSYYSTGKEKGRSIYKNGVYQTDKIYHKLLNYYNQSQELYKQVNYSGAIKKLDKAIELDSTWADGYFARGTMKLNDFQFDEAVKDFDKTIEIEPCYTNAYSNKAFAILRKYELGNGRILSKTKDIQIIATKKTEIPKSELTKICGDLNKAISLGDDSSMVLEALEKHCKD